MRVATSKYLNSKWFLLNGENDKSTSSNEIALMISCVYLIWLSDNCKRDNVMYFKSIKQHKNKICLVGIKVGEWYNGNFNEKASLNFELNSFQAFIVLIIIAHSES